MATFSGILRARRNRPPAPAIRHRFTSGIPNAARWDATTEIGRQYQLGPAGQGRSVDGGDDGLAPGPGDEPPETTPLVNTLPPAHLAPP